MRSMPPVARSSALAAAVLAAAFVAGPALGQVSDSERAAARELFKQGDELQRDGRFAEALDKFERAQQVFSAPTNLLRIAECQAALGKLVESAESYRTVVRTPLPSGSPPAFQSAVAQAKAELSQVEPRVPRLVVRVEPSSVTSPHMQIDGQSVPSALIGEPIPLDPGSHRVMVFAPGYVSSEQVVLLKDGDSKTVPVGLTPVATVAYGPGAPGANPSPSGPAASGLPAAVPPLPPPDASAGSTALPPAPPVVEGAPTGLAPRHSRMGIILGAHLGVELMAGSLPLDANSSVDAPNISGSGFAYAFDGGFRFGRIWYVGLTVQHASFGQGKDLTQLGDVTNVSSDATLAALVLALIANPDRTSFYFELGLGNRWYSFTQDNRDGTQSTNRYSAGEGLLGAGVWIPIGRSLRLLPKATLAGGAFSPPGQDTSSGSNNLGHLFFMLGVAGFYNLDL
jgi:hypothetical protein